jgi:hypothetical protein
MHLLFKYSSFLSIFLYLFFFAKHSLILKKLANNGDIDNFPYGKRGPYIKRVKEWIIISKNEIIKNKLEKALLWGRLTYAFFFVTVILIILQLIS